MGPAQCLAHNRRCPGGKGRENAWAEQFHLEGCGSSPSQFRGWAGTHWIPKRGSSTARLSHKPSMANLLAQ